MKVVMPCRMRKTYSMFKAELRNEWSDSDSYFTGFCYLVLKQHEKSELTSLTNYCQTNGSERRIAARKMPEMLATHSRL
jgi:hypothetical protein